MSLVAPLSKYKKKTLLIWMGMCVILAAWFAYDGFVNQTFITKHTSAEGTPDSTLVFNQKAPFPLLVVAGLLGGYLLLIRNRKVVADETGLVIDDKLQIAYGSILKIDKTHFDSKGRFTITYKNPGGKETDLVISDRKYDNLSAILEHTVAKIS